MKWYQVLGYVIASPIILCGVLYNLLAKIVMSLIILVSFMCGGELNDPHIPKFFKGYWSDWSIECDVFDYFPNLDR